MQVRKYLLSLALVVALGLLLAAAEAADPTIPLPFTGFTDLPRSCILKNSKLVTTHTIQAGLNPTTDPFPLPVTCPGGPACAGLTGNFLRWDYQFTYIGVKPTNALLSFSTDTDLLATLPTALVIAPGLKDNDPDMAERIFEAFVISYPNTTQSTFNASYFTKTGVAPRQATAGVKSGDSTAGACRLAGAGVPGDPFQPVSVTQTVIVAGGKCQVDLIFDQVGNLIDIQDAVALVPGAICNVVSPEVVLVNNKPLQNNTSPSGITFGDNTTTCYGPPKPRRPICVCTTETCP